MLCKISKRLLEQVSTRIRHEYSGNVRLVAKVGDMVSPISTLAVIDEEEGEKVINLAKLLEVKPKEVAQFVVQQVGAKLLKGEIIAKKPRTLVSRDKVFNSPVDGSFMRLTEEGEMVLRYPSRSYKLNSQVEGRVEGVGEGYIDIEVTADVSYGFTCSGISSNGPLVRLGNRTEELNPDRLDSSYSGKIIFGGHTLTPSFVERASILDVRGIIVGSVSKQFYDQYQKVDSTLPILVTECYGTVPLGLDMYDFLVRKENKMAFLFANECRLVIPEKAAPKYAEAHLEAGRELRINDRVVIPDFLKGTQVGSVQAVRFFTPTNSMLQTEIVLVKLDGGGELETFASNLEILT